MTDLPQDPVLLLSVVNTELRDMYPTLDAFCAAHMTDKKDLNDRLEAIDYTYDPVQNQFV